MTKKWTSDAILKPAIRMTVLSMVAVAWYLLAGYLFLVFFPTNFRYYNTLITDQGTTTFDVYYLWAWIPTLLIFTIGIFWASGLLNQLWRILSRL